MRSKGYRNEFTIREDGRVATGPTTADSLEHNGPGSSDYTRRSAGLVLPLRRWRPCAACGQWLAQLRGERDGLDDGLIRTLKLLRDKPGGRLRGELAGLGFDPALIVRIADATGRRNDLIHHPAEDRVLTPGLLGRDVEAAIAPVSGCASWVNAVDWQMLLAGVTEVLEHLLGFRLRNCWSTCAAATSTRCMTNGFGGRSLQWAANSAQISPYWKDLEVEPNRKTPLARGLPVAGR